MRDLTAAQNIFIGREPRKFGGLLLDEAKLNADAADIFASHASEARSAYGGRRG